jgi:hypothetical protein
LEGLRSTNERRKFYRGVNNARKGFKPRISMCKAKDGTIISDQQSILARWSEHFDELLNKPDIVPSEGVNPLSVQSGWEPSVQDVEPPSYEEVDQAIVKLKNNKAPGIDGIPAELFKYGGQELKRRLYQKTLDIWIKEELPDEWNYGIICLLHKKDDLMVCENYRGISLLNVAYKVLSTILYHRLV